MSGVQYYRILGYRSQRLNLPLILSRKLISGFMKHILSLKVLGNTANTVSQWESVDVFCNVLAPIPSADVNLTLLTICIENSNELYDGGRTSFASQFMLAVLRQSDVKLAMLNFKGYISLSII